MRARAERTDRTGSDPTDRSDLFSALALAAAVVLCLLAQALLPLPAGDPFRGTLVILPLILAGLREIRRWCERLRRRSARSGRHGRRAGGSGASCVLLRAGPPASGARADGGRPRRRPRCSCSATAWRGRSWLCVRSSASGCRRGRRSSSSCCRSPPTWPSSRGPTGHRQPDGDEPFNLLITHSLAYDFDADLTNNYARGDWKHFMERPIEPQPGDPRGPHGEIYSRHNELLPLLLAPAYRLAGRIGALAMMAMLTASARLDDACASAAPLRPGPAGRGAGRPGPWRRSRRRSSSTPTRSGSRCRRRSAAGRRARPHPRPRRPARLALEGVDGDRSLRAAAAAAQDPLHPDRRADARPGLVVRRAGRGGRCFSSPCCSPCWRGGMLLVQPDPVLEPAQDPHLAGGRSASLRAALVSRRFRSACSGTPRSACSAARRSGSCCCRRSLLLVVAAPPAARPPGGADLPLPGRSWRRASSGTAAGRRPSAMP